MKQPRWAFIHPFQLRLQRGIEVYLWGLASALAESGVEVDILTWSGSLNVPAYVSPQVQIRRVPEMRYYQHVGAVLFYVWYLVKGHYDHIFVHFADYGEGVALNLARRITNVPFSVVFHFPPSLVPHRYRAFERWGFQKNAAHLIAVSQATASEVERWSGRSCTVISHGVDTERFKPNAQVRIQVREELGISSAAPVLVSVAALEERKGIQWGIKAMPVLLQEYPDLQYVVIGEGGYRSQLEGLAAKLGLKKSVHFLGAQLDVQPYLCAADMMLVLAKGDTFRFTNRYCLFHEAATLGFYPSFSTAFTARHRSLLVGTCFCAGRKRRGGGYSDLVGFIGCACVCFPTSPNKART